MIIKTENNYTPKFKGNKEDQWRDLCMCETGTGEQVAQLPNTYMMMMMVMKVCLNKWVGIFRVEFNLGDSSFLHFVYPRHHINKYLGYEEKS
jgi:hypothetical protein